MYENTQVTASEQPKTDESMMFKKFFVFFILGFIINGFICSQEQPPFGFSFAAHTGFTNSCVDELAYENSTQISKLVWNRQFVPQLGMDVRLRLWKVLLDAQCDTAVPVKSGYLADFDYLTGTPGIVSHYSEHDVYTDSDFSIRAHVSFEVDVIRNHYRLYPFAGITYRRRNFSARDGFLQYPATTGGAWTGNEPEQYLNGTIISYEQTIWYPYIGLENVFIFRDSIRMGLSVSYYPYVSVSAIDNHYLRLQQFYDSMKDGSGVNIEWYLVYMPFKTQKNIGLKLSVNYELFSSYGTTSIADIGIRTSGSIQSAGSGAGTRSNQFGVSFGILYNSAPAY